jgi:hypothetical protein
MKNIISGWLEFKKLTLIIIALSLIVAALAGLYVMNNNTIGENATKSDSVDIKVTIEQPKSDSDKSAAFRKGEFKKSKPVSW